MPNKIKEILFKPKWLHKDPAVRGQAVAESNDPRLLEKLADYARQDPDAGVRLRAAKRLTDMYHLMRLASDDADASVRDYAYRSYRSMLAGNHPHTPALDQRLEIVPKLEDEALIEFLATDASDRAIRAAAQAKVKRQGLLGDIVMQEDDARLRQAAAERIEQRSTLERVAEAMRRRDKNLYRRLKQKIEAARIAAGDTELLQQQATTLCERLETLARGNETTEEKERQLDQIDAAWQQLALPSAASIHTRFQGARQILQTALTSQPEAAPATTSALEQTITTFLSNGLLSDAPSLDALQQQIEQIEAWLKQQPVLPDAICEQLTEVHQQSLERRQTLLDQQPAAGALVDLCEKLEAMDENRPRARALAQTERAWQQAWQGTQTPTKAELVLQQRFQRACQRLQSVIEAQQRQQQQAAAELDPLMTRLEQHLDAGDLAQSVQAKTAILALLETLGRHPKVRSAAFKSELHRLRGRLAELRDWQHWANNRVRTRLCEEAESLTESDLHPDAIAEKVKQLNSQWRELDQQEKLPGDHPKRPVAPGLYRRFQGACNRAFVPIKPYFEKRAELRDQRQQQLEELITTLQSAVEDRDFTEPKQLERLIRQGRGSLRELRGVAARERGRLSKQLRQAADALDQRLEAHYEVVEGKKQRIIEEVQTLIDHDDLQHAVASAKQAQRRWQEAGHSRRSREQKLWREFRAASDAIFARLSEQRSGEQQARQDQLGELNNLIEQLEGLLRLPPQELTEAVSQLPRIRDQWRQIGLQDRKLDARMQQLVADIESAAATIANQQVQAQREQIRQLARACQALESSLLNGQAAGPIREQIEQTELDRKQIPNALAERIARATAADAEASLSELTDPCLENALALCIQMEFLAGVESPEAYKQARMDYQVQRLSERMSGQATRAPQDEAQQLESTWLGCGPLPADQAEPLSQRFWHALTVFEQNH